MSGYDGGDVSSVEPSVASTQHVGDEDQSQILSTQSPVIPNTQNPNSGNFFNVVNLSYKE